MPVTLYAVHDRQLAEHGGLTGVRDLNAVESALCRAQNLDAYSELNFMLAVAAGGKTEVETADWIRQRMVA
jgi:prophage maintenance system killer protein